MSHGCTINETTCKKAAESGQLDVIKWLASKMDAWSNTFSISNSWGHSIACAAASRGHLHVLEWMFQNANKKIKVTPKLVGKAARNGHMHILEWLQERDQQIPLLQVLCEKAAKGGYLNILEWATKNGAQFGYNTFVQAIIGGHMKTIQYLNDCGAATWTEEVLGIAAEMGHLEVLKWTFENGITNYKKICESSATGGHLDILKWIHKNNLPWKKDWICYFPQHNTDYLHALKWSLDIGSKLKGITCAQGAGNLEVLKFLRQNGIVWYDFLWRAVEIGNVEILKWAFANGCTWNDFEDYNESIWEQAGKSGNVEVIKLLFEMEKPTHKACSRIGHYAAMRNYLDALKFVLKQEAVCIDSLYIVDETGITPTSVWLWKQADFD